MRTNSIKTKSKTVNIYRSEWTRNKIRKCQSSTFISMHNHGNLIRIHSSWNGKFEAYQTTQRNEMKFNWITVEKWREDAFQSSMHLKPGKIACLPFILPFSIWFKCAVA